MWPVEKAVEKPADLNVGSQNPLSRLSSCLNLSKFSEPGLFEVTIS